MNNAYDLNVLKYMNILLKLKNVSKAAKYLGISQPALSNALAKMRVQFKDPLLVRNGQAMELTLKAIQLAPRLDQLMTQFEDLMKSTEDFNPQSTHVNFNFSSSDYASLMVVPDLAGRLKNDFPFVKIHVDRLIEKDLHLKLSDLSYDFVLGTGFKTNIPSSLYAKTLFQDHFAVACSDNHPRIKGDNISIEEYLKEDHLFVNPEGLNAEIIDSVLSKKNQSRNVALTLPHISVACHSLQQNDYLLTLPRRALEITGEGLNIKVLDLPFEVPKLDITIIWHERTHQHASHKWMREILSSLKLSK